MNYLKLLMLVMASILFCSCQDTDLTESVTEDVAQTTNDEGLSFLTFPSKDALKETVDLMKSGYSTTRALSLKAIGTRSAIGSMVPVSQLQNFESLYDANKKKCLASLTPEQLDSVQNDEDDLEYCLSDSVIADAELAKLLNASREIQVADTVYKFFPNCVAYAPANNVSKLREFDASKLQQSSSSLQGGMVQEVEKGVYVLINPFGPQPTTPQKPKVDDGDTNYEINNSLTLKDGTYIPASSVRNINYDTENDAGWFHKLWNGMWGRNVIAINKFSKNRKLRLGFYDENYIIYANIGVLMKMQKKVCGIWWNCKAEDIRVGWNGIELVEEYEKPIVSYIASGISQSKVPVQGMPDFMKHNFPFKNEESILLKVPFVDYNVKVKNINAFIRNQIDKLSKTMPQALSNMINKTPERDRGLFSYNDKLLYCLIARDEEGGKNKRTFEKKFYKEVKLGFLLNFGWGIGSSSSSFPTISLNLGRWKSVHLGRGVVYGAVKYKGRWLGARIVKESND